MAANANSAAVFASQLEIAKQTLRQRSVNRMHEKRMLAEGASSALAQALASRGVRSLSAFRSGFASLLPVSAMKNAVALGELLADLVESQERLLIVCDYDCDGATAASVLLMAFRAAGMNFGYLVPDRQVHGYGLTPLIVEEAAALTPRPAFIITVDNGISSTAGVDRANELGIAVLVTDHHLAPTVLPAARIIVNPNQPGCTFPSKNIAGCGVAWYATVAMHAALEKRGLSPGFEPRELLTYVAIGTVADVVQMDDNNRALVREGLGLIRDRECAPGIVELALVAKRNIDYLTTTDIGFGLGPAINAAGRLAHMSAGVQCLTTDDPVEAKLLAAELQERNQERKEIQKEMVDVAVAKARSRATERHIASGESPLSVIVYEGEWHEGVVGIVAGRLKEDFHRPTFVLCDVKDGCGIKGSGRSIPGFHLKHALDKVNVLRPGLLEKFGGHAMAAGLTIGKGRLEEFREIFEQVCQEDLTPDLLTKVLEHDGPIPLESMNIDDIREMNMEPWGQGFQEPLYFQTVEVLEYKTMGSEKQHLKLRVMVGGSGEMDLVAFGEAARASYPTGQLDIAFKANINDFRGRSAIQLMAQSIVTEMPTMGLAFEGGLADQGASNLSPVVQQPVKTTLPVVAAAPAVEVKEVALATSEAPIAEVSAPRRRFSK